MAIGTVERDHRYRLCDIDSYAVSHRPSFLNKSSRDVSHDRTDIASAPRLAVGRCVGNLVPVGEDRFTRRVCRDTTFGDSDHPPRTPTPAPHIDFTLPRAFGVRAA